MLVSTGAVFSLVEANKKTHSLKSVMTNLNFALESMAREIRVGREYNCDALGDCTAGGTSFQFKSNRDINGDGTYNEGDQMIYSIVITNGKGSITRRILGSDPGGVPITASEINIESLRFYVIGTAASPADTKQPKVVISIQGSAGEGKIKSNFNIQTTLSQRAIDS